MKKSKKTFIKSALPVTFAPSAATVATLLQQALALHQAGKIAEAEQQYRNILAKEPAHAAALGLLGAACIQQNKLEEALQYLNQAIAINPNDADLYSNRGVVLRKLNQYQEALESYQKALSIYPQHADAQNNINNIGIEFYQAGIHAFRQKEYQLALNHFNNALVVNPQMAEAYNDRGNLLYLFEQYEYAIHDYRKAFQLKPHLDWVCGNYIHTKALICQWDNIDSEIEELSQRIGRGEKASNCFSFVSLSDSLFLQYQVAAIRAQNHPIRNDLGCIPPRSAKSKIRIAYFSTDFCEHAVAHVTAELFELHDRQRFEVIAFSLGVDKNDAMRQRLIQAFDKFIDVRDRTEKEIAQLARNLEIDIAVDLNGFTAANRFDIFTYRAAPIQVSYIGYPGTSGSACMDYIIADPILIPHSAQNYFSEKIIYLPHSYQVNDRKRKISDKVFTREELGLPSTGFIFCCLNNNYKIMPSTFASWMRILQQVPHSVLWLLADNPTAAHNLQQAAVAHGIDTHRLIFFPRMPLPEYLSAQRVADLFLDTFPYNAHATGSGALWAGLPILTRMGESFASRVGASLLNAIGLPELVTTTAEEFEAKAIELAFNPEKLQAIREKLHHNRLNTPLFDSELFTRHLENAYEQMIQRYDAGLPPEHIQIAPYPISLFDLEKKAFSLHCNGQLEEAKEIYLEILNKNPNLASTLGLLGNIYLSQNKFEESLYYLDRSIAENSNDTNTHSNRAYVLNELGRYEDALASCNLALNIDNGNINAYINRSNSLTRLKRHTEAIANCNDAIAIDAKYLAAHFNKGNALLEIGQYKNAIASFTEAIHINPQFYKSYINRSNTFLKLKLYQEAIHDCQHAIKFNPECAEAYVNCGIALKELKQHQLAIQNFETALKLNKNIHIVHGHILYAKANICYWPTFKKDTEELANKIHLNQNASDCFPLLSILDAPSLHRKAAENFTKKSFPFNSELGLISKHSTTSKIRIGYFSSDFNGNHPVANVITELFELHDKNRFEIIAFSFGVDTQDALRQRIVKAFDQFIDVRNHTDKEIAQLARNIGIDIAIDLNGFTTDNRFGIFAYRAAPIQVCYLGYPGTVGAEYMDYLIADPIIIPPEFQIHYSGKIAYLPYCYQVNDRKRIISNRVFTREELGLPESVFVFCCFNNNYKITPYVFDSWMKILHQVPNSILWLAKDNDNAVENLRHEAQQRGIDTKRIIFAQRVPLTEDYLARNRMADLFLDTLPYNAHSTASDALWAGLPVLTRMGESFASRVAGSLLHAIGLTELITKTAAEFEAKAIELALNPEKLQAIREKLDRNRLTTPLFDSESFTRHIENAYTQMMQRYQANQLPEHIYISPTLSLDELIQKALQLHQAGQFMEAAVIYRDILSIEPYHAIALGLLGTIHLQNQQWNEALTLLSQSIALKPDYAEAYSNRGIIFNELHQYEKAISDYDKAISLKPNYAEAYANRGHSFNRLKKHQEAIQDHDKAIALNPNLIETFINKGETLLSIGDFTNGLPFYESRWLSKDLINYRRNFTQPSLLETINNNLAGKTIFIYAEQGFGDTIQFCRYIPMVAALGVQIVLEVPPSLERLLHSIEGITKIITVGQPLPSFDIHCPLLSLPLAFKTTLESIPPVVPLYTEKSRIPFWEQQLGERKCPRIGLAWSGRERPTGRNIPLAQLLKYLPAELTYVSLQKDIRPADMAALQTHTNIVHFGDKMTDFADTAALCACVDWVISIDTGVAHLAASLGKPTWVMLSYTPDWRWLLERRDSPWYPSIQLYRQDASCAWEPVLAQISHDLRIHDNFR